MGWTRRYKGYYICYWGSSYDVRNKNLKLLFTSKTIKQCKEFINELLKEVLGK